jgi:hypothetical protein
MITNYIVEISESNGKLSISSVEKLVKVNQYKSELKTLPKNTFQLVASDASKKASRKSRSGR